MQEAVSELNEWSERAAGCQERDYHSFRTPAPLPQSFAT